MKAPQSTPRFLSIPQQRQFRKRVLAWYERHRRDLPWRANRDPYRVWLSEIMLQQTRVAAVIDHYQEFLRRFPTVEKLATAREASVLAAWSGLGYYRRARMLHAATKVVVREHGGKFPATAEAWRALPGVGRYTAAAIASIAFDEPAAVVDGNVERVLQRVSGKRLTGEELWNASNDLLDAKRPGDFNQAVMELGAVVCTPRAPACLTCPVIQLCVTRGELPPLAKPARQRKREIHYALSLRDGEVFLVQRPRDVSLMAGMWELPELADMNGGEFSVVAPASRRLSRGRLALAGGSGMPPRQPPGTAAPSNHSPLLTLRHSITITDYTVRVWRAASPSRGAGRWIPVERLRQVALTGLARKILRKSEVL
ncbi:MAG: A/G-specific adenine glycosylase [Candidatus Sulfotelmatobacter sp.]